MREGVGVELVHPARQILGCFMAPVSLVWRRHQTMGERIGRDRRANPWRDEVVHRAAARHGQRARRRVVAAGRPFEAEADDLGRPAVLFLHAVRHAVPQREEDLAVTRDEGADLGVLAVALLALLRDALQGVAVHHRQLEHALGGVGERAELGEGLRAFEVLLVERARQRQRHDQPGTLRHGDARDQAVGPFRQRREHDQRAVRIPGRGLGHDGPHQSFEGGHVRGPQIAMPGDGDDQGQRSAPGECLRVAHACIDV